MDYVGTSKQAIQEAVNACTQFELTTTGPILNGLQQAYQTGDGYLFFSQLWLMHKLGDNSGNDGFINCVADFLTSLPI